MLPYFSRIPYLNHPYSHFCSQVCFAVCVSVVLTNLIGGGTTAGQVRANILVEAFTLVATRIFALLSIDHPFTGYMYYCPGSALVKRHICPRI